MRIKYLKIKNLASIEQAELDFTSGVLARQSLFLITGPTGAGKTTILDAITLALFGTTARFSQAIKENLEEEAGECAGLKTDDCRRLVRRGADSCYIELVFDGNDGQEYKVSWSVRKKRTGPLDEVDRTIVTPSSIISGSKQVKNFIKDVTNIDFDQYCKTTMLAQGDFTRFLKSKVEEKSLILEKILNVDIFTKIGARISVRYNECKRKCDEKRNLIANLSVAPDEEIDKIRQSVTEYKELAVSLKAMSIVVSSKKDWLIRYSENKVKLANAKEELAKFESAATTPDNIKRRSCIALWDRTERLRSLLCSQKADAEALSAEKNKLRYYVDNFNHNAALFHARKTSIANELGKLNEMRDEVSTLSSLIGDGAPKDKNEAHVQKSRLETVLRDVLVAKSTLESLSIVGNDLKVKEGVILEIRNKIRKLQDETSKALTMKLETESRKKIADERMEEINKKCDYATEVIKMVHVGDACPVCGGTIEHLGCIDQFEAVKVPFRQEQAEAAKAAMEAAKHYSESKLDLDKLHNQEVSELSIMKKAKDKYRNVRDELVSLLQRIGENGYEGLDVINIQDVSTYLIKKQEEGRERLEILDRLYKTLDAKESLKTKIAYEQEKFSDAGIIREKVLSSIPNWRDNKIEDIKDDQSVNILSCWSEYYGNLTQWMTAVNILRESTEAREVEIENEKKIANIEIETVNELTASYSQAKVADERRSLELIDEMIVSSKRSVADLENALKSLEAGKPDMALNETVESLCQSDMEIHKKLDETNIKIGACENMLKAHAENKKRRMNEEETLKKLEAEFAKWDSLSFISDVNGKKFRTIALNYIFDELLDYSNMHLKDLTDGRFTLERNGALNISIRDALHCDAIQTPANLSGGEGFMVSLALSLGLASMSEGVGDGSDILFIDEGFGTLDDEYLEKVTTLLEKLRDKGGKRVGIISHVDILKEKIPAQVRVEPVDPSRSRVTVVG